MKALDELISAFRRFPGVGPKQAERFALYVVRASGPEIDRLAEILHNVKETIGYCRECWDYTEKGLCSICSDSARDHSVLCVVERPQDVAAIEKSKTFNGVYHVLHGSISPLAGINSSQIKFKELAERVKNSGGGFKEIILALNPDSEGEATAIYITNALKPYGVKLTRLACGVPLGGDIDYMDEVTLGCALRGRTLV
ncbi:MAG: recombination mediator RecR [Elusimicrobiales bacterium]|nr:recombination mediator RecR [Elusimicrobiales bacterium]